MAMTAWLRAGLGLALCFSVAASARAATADAQAAADRKAVAACLAGKKDGDAATKLTCVGTVSKPCQEKPEGQTMEGSVECVGRETAAWDALLNEAYKTEMAAAKDADDGAKAGGGDDRSAQDSLKKAQRAWIAFRDAECDRRFDLFRSGTYRLDAAAACQLELTSDRAVTMAVSGN